MSWLYSQALVAELSEATCSDGEQSALSSGSPIPQAYCAPDKMTAFSRLSRYGMTFGLLTDDRGEELLMWYRGDFLARTSPSQEKAQGLTESAAGCGRTWPASLAKYDHATHSLRTAQLSLIEDSTGCSVTLPRSGTMRNGECYQQPTLERLTLGNESGLWPTPDTCAGGTGPSQKNRKSPRLQDAVMMWPTPAARDWKGATITENYPDGFNTNLATAVVKSMWPTPQASDNRDRGNLSTPAIARRVEKGKQVMLSMAVSTENGRLNPEWVEWLMGWPVGHTDLRPLAMDKFHEWQRQHSPNCVAALDGSQRKEERPS